MQRRHFLLIAAIIPTAFGAFMMLAPEQMLANSLTSATEPATGLVTQWVGFGVFTLGVINFFSRNDPGSPALRAVMTGNVVFHSLGLAFDVYDFSIGAMTASGLITGLVPHSLLIAGFVFYLIRSPR